MTNGQHLKELLQNIAQITGESTSKEDAIKMGHQRFLFLENNPTYGGWRLVNVNTKSGTHTSAFGFSDAAQRLKYKEMVIRLEGILAGLQLAHTLHFRK